MDLDNDMARKRNELATERAELANEQKKNIKKPQLQLVNQDEYVIPIHRFSPP